MSQATETIEQAIIERIAARVTDLLEQHWPKIVQIRDADPDSEVDISLSFRVNCTQTRPKLIGKIRYAQKFGDESEEWIEDPNQEKLNL